MADLDKDALERAFRVHFETFIEQDKANGHPPPPGVSFEAMSPMMRDAGKAALKAAILTYESAMTEKLRPAEEVARKLVMRFPKTFGGERCLELVTAAIKADRERRG